MTQWTTLCGDPTCNSYGCSKEALNAWYDRQNAEARAVVLQLLTEAEDTG